MSIRLPKRKDLSLFLFIMLVQPHDGADADNSKAFTEASQPASHNVSVKKESEYICHPEYRVHASLSAPL